MVRAVLLIVQDMPKYQEVRYLKQFTGQKNRFGENY